MKNHPYLNISLSQIQVFLAVAEYKNFTMAARRLNLTQSAVSKTIATIEAILQLPLFERKRELTLTPAGELLKEKWAGVIENVESAIMEAELRMISEKEVLRIGKPNYITIKQVVDSITQFQANNPRVEIMIEDVEYNDLFTQLQLGTLDAIFTVSVSKGLLAEIGASFVDVSDPVHAMITIHRNNPLSKKDKLTLKDLKDEGFLSLTSAAYQPYIKIFTEACKNNGFEPKILARFPNVKSLFSTLAVTGNGIALSNSYVLDTYRDVFKSYKIKEVDSTLILAWQDTNRTKKNVLDKFITTLSDYRNLEATALKTGLKGKKL